MGGVVGEVVVVSSFVKLMALPINPKNVNFTIMAICKKMHKKIK